MLDTEVSECIKLYCKNGKGKQYFYVKFRGELYNLSNFQSIYMH
jgi:hypothetical protein